MKKIIFTISLFILLIFCFAGCTKINTLEGVTAEDYYNDGYTNNYVVGIDQFGRTFESVLGDKDDKERDVGIFYFLTLGQHGATKIYDVSKILEQENGMDLLFYQDSEEVPNGAICFWGEPIYGYYNSSDTWVIRRHLELLTAAGVDFLVFDTTNAVTYDNVVPKIIQEVQRLKENGWDCPELVFYTNAYSHNTIKKLYQKYYRSGKYDECWYKVDGKPLIIGLVDDNDDYAEAIGRGVKNYTVESLSDEILEFFTFRESQWPSSSFKEDGFPWMEWSYPSPVHNDVINVAVAAHPALPMSFSITRGAKNWGRGWSVTKQENISEDAAKGTFFQSNWDTALSEDPGIVFVTGWNEWVAGKSLYDGEYALVDLANMEFSRDVEIMKGGYEDAFYMQLAANIRKYKSVEIAENSQLPVNNQTIDINGDNSLWDDVKAVFRTTNDVNKARNSYGAATEIQYKQDAARNNIELVKIASDDDNFYFYIKCSEDIVLREGDDETWMNLFIGTGSVENTGFNGYEYVIGRKVQDGKLTVEKLKSDYSGTVVGTCSFVVSGDVLKIEIPRKLLSVKSGQNNIYFKVADGIENPSDIMDYYVTGKSFPVGRLSYRYLG